MLGKEQRAEIKKEAEVGLATTNQEKKCFNCSKSGHYKNNCQSKSNNQNGNGHATTCYLCGRIGHKMARCWENPENASKRPEGYKPKLSLDEVKKKITEKSKTNGSTTQSLNNSGNNNSKTQKCREFMWKLEMNFHAALSNLVKKTRSTVPKKWKLRSVRQA